jgi:signal transduction histidine kinase/CheY-like chemotaxis protein/PAS domain-containing protein
MNMLSLPGLRSRFMLIVLLAFVVLGGIDVWQTMGQRELLMQATSERLLSAARLLAAQQQVLMGRGDALLNSLMQEPRLSRGNGAACAHVLVSYLQREDDFFQAGMILPNGDVACTALAGKAGVNIADRPWFQQALSSNHMALSDVTVSRVLDTGVINFLKARRDEQGRVQAVFYLSMSVERLQRSLRVGHLPPGTRTLVMNEAGKVVLPQSAELDTVARSLFTQPGVQRILRERSHGIERIVGPDQAPSLLAYTPVLMSAGGSQLQLWLSLPEALVEAPVQRQFVISLAVMLTLLMATLAGVAWGTDRYLVQPLHRLAQTARRFGSGDLAAKASLPRQDDEMDELTLALDAMAQDLQISTVSRDQLQDEIKAHQLTQEQLRLTLAGAGAGCFEIECETGRYSWSRELWDLLGLALNSVPASYESWRQTVHPDDLAQVESLVLAARAAGTASAIEWRVKVPATEPPRWLMSLAQPVLGSDGRVARYCGLVIDITQRKQAELALSQYREQLEAIVLERTANMVAAQAEQRRLNHSLRLLSDCNVALVRASHEAQLLDELCRLVVNSGGYRLAWVGLAQQDAAKSVQPVAHAGDTTGYLDRIRVSWDAAQAIGCGPTGIAIRSGTTQVSLNCKSSEQMSPWREAIERCDYQSIVALPLRMDDQVQGALTISSADPHAFGVEEVRALEELVSNMAFGLQSLRARQELALYQQQLEKLVKERTRQIAALNAELLARVRDAESANQAKGIFLATMSHELRTPLNAVVGLTGLLADAPLGRRQRDYADKIQLSAQTLRVLIDDILDFSKIEAGELQLEQAPFSLNAILRTSAAVLGVSLRDKPIEALFDVAPDIPDLLVGDAMRLQQILLNLISNAVKFTEVGVIVVSVTCLARQASEVSLQFAVHDTGIGIAPAKLATLFEGFSQAEVSTSRLYGGTGLGLAISARLVKLLGGRMQGDSTLGGGSEFRFQIPLALDPNPPVPTLAIADMPTALQVLLVDDHPQARAMLSQTCRAFGWQVTALDSGAAGLAELHRSADEARDYDVLLLDWRMPGMDGLEMLRQAYASPDIGLPLVVLLASVFELEQAAAASDDLYLDGIAAKPLTPASLLETVQRAYSGQSRTLLPDQGKTDHRLRGMCLLVAEDNPLNQEVIEQVLTRAGAQVVMAGTGLAAVEAVRASANHFDAVLMDIQMPVMDGYTATRIIRDQLGRRDLPIIAVTAFARPEDRERSRQAGMVGHVVKPLDVEDLLDLLARERTGTGANAVPRDDSPPVDVIPESELPGLDLVSALEAFGGEKDKYKAILRKFLLRHGGDVDEARRLFSADDAQGASSLLHGLSGVASILHAPVLASLARTAEQALLEGQVDALPGLFTELHEAMHVLWVSIEQLELLWTEV